MFFSSPWSLWRALPDAAGYQRSLHHPPFRPRFSFGYYPRSFSLHLYPSGSLIGPFVWGWHLRSFQPQAGHPSLAIVSALSTHLARLEGDGLRLSVLQPGNLRRGSHIATDSDPALLSDLVRRGPIDAAFSLTIYIGFVSIPFWT